MAGGGVSMRDVARKAGVAVSTVSRALSDPERINPVTRDLVLRAATELGYAAIPRPAGPRRRGLVALLVPDITNSFYFDIIRGAQDRLFQSGYLQVLVNTEGSGEEERIALESLVGLAQGAVLTTSRLGDDEVLSFAERLPLVTLNRSVPGIRDVSIDTPRVVAEAVEHLAALGHRTLCYVSGPEQSVINRRRWDSCQDAAELLGLEVTRIGPFSPWAQTGQAAAEMLLGTGATGVVAFNDVLAMGVVRRLIELGVSVPGDISVVGCDDIEAGATCSPPLTTISAPAVDVGRRLTSMLLAVIDGDEEPPLEPVPVHLVVRGSTGPAPARD